jgi:hypothetical protein
MTVGANVFKSNYLLIMPIEIIFFNFNTEGPPMWSRGQSVWLQIQRSRFNSWHYQIFCEVSLVSTTEELLGRKSSGSGLEIQEYGCRDQSR